MRLSLVFHVCGLLIRLFGVIYLAPVAVAVYFGEYHDAVGFALAAVITGGLGELMRRAGGSSAEEAVERMRRIEGLAVVSAVWLIAATLAAIPFIYIGMDPANAVFEAMSGLTASGATVLADFERYGRAVFFWRTLTHWVGGLGVIALFVAILPRLAIGGRELFFAEAPGPSDEKVSPQIRRTASLLWRLYAALTVLQTVALWLAGLSWFDALSHAMSTLAAGGFSPHEQSISAYQNPAVEWIIIVFMLVAGANFALQYRALARRDVRILAADEELRAYIGIVVIATVLIALALGPSENLHDTLRAALFQSVSILTTTGFSSVDFQQWNEQAKLVLLVLMFIGGCAGSASGGPKVVRHIVLARYTLQELRRTLHPRAVLPVKLGGRVVPDAVVRSVVVFFLFYLLMFSICTGIVVAFGADIVTGVTATLGCLGNIGPGFNEVGPAGHYGNLHPVSKITLTLAMWIGRLEVLTVLVVLRPEAWRSAQWAADGRGAASR